jgi:Na+/proline symporter
MNSLATVVVNDFVRPLRRVTRPEQQDVKLARMLTLLFGVFGVGVAFFIAQVEHIFKACAIVGSLFASPVLSLFLLGTLTRRVNFKGWLIATVVAIAVTAYVQFYTPIHWIYYSAASMVVCIPLSYAFSPFFRIPLADPGYTVAGTIQEWQEQH